MPRPGPRPYECVRRAWHSDRHQPIRGSLIQEIFRVVNEIHCPATKKNKEWQEKLPIVVLKSEEIMYSKANSETEYMDLETLLDRTNDAISTIIRRDEGTETEGLLQPCIEAALTLGCTPRRASRSQRNSGPQCYLSGNTQEPAGFSPNMFEKATINDQNSIWQTNSVMNHGTKNHSIYSEKAIPCNNNLGLHVQPQPLSNLCSVYPLYYGNFLKVKTPPCNFRFADNCSSGAVQSDREVMFGNLKSSSEDSSNKKSEIKCDLSLRLGPHSPRVTEGVGHSDLLPEMSKFSHTNNVEDQRSSWLSEFSCGFVRGVPRNSSS